MSNLYEYATYDQVAGINVASTFGRQVHMIARKSFSVHRIRKMNKEQTT